jgi:hypothetical protein
MRKSAIELGNRIDIATRSSPCALYLSTVEFWFDGSYDLSRYSVLQIENIVQRAVKSIRPQMSTCSGVDKLSGNPHATTGLADASFEHITHTQLTPNLLDINCLALVGETRIARDHEQ